MKLSKLTFKTERVDIEQGSGLGKYLAFYFYIDGKEIGKEEYNPADYDDILASDKDMIFIQHCGCGIRECSALVANVKSVSTDVVEWSINEYRYDAGAEIYHFAKAEYEKTMAQVYNEAYLEGVEQNSSRYASILKMEQEDSLSLFWDIEGTCVGNAEHISLKNDTYNLKFAELQKWADSYMWQVLVPSESGEITLEETNKIFDWKSFHKQGIAIAVEVKRLLPKDVVLKYSTPFEDRSAIFPNEVLIDDDEWYVKNVLAKIV